MAKPRARRKTPSVGAEKTKSKKRSSAKKSIESKKANTESLVFSEFIPNKQTEEIDTPSQIKKKQNDSQNTDLEIIRYLRPEDLKKKNLIIVISGLATFVILLFWFFGIKNNFAKIDKFTLPTNSILNSQNRDEILSGTVRPAPNPNLNLFNQ